MSAPPDQKRTDQAKPKGKGRGKGKKDRKPFVEHDEKALERQSESLGKSTELPRDLRQAETAGMQDIEIPKSILRTKNQRLRARLIQEYLSHQRATMHAALADEFLHVAAPGEEAGLIEVEDEMERTARVRQADIRDSVGVETARKSFTLSLDGGRSGVGMGPYRCDYTRNGRHLVLAGRKGHLAAFDWQAGTLSFEINVKDTVRDVKWLHNQDFVATAQKKYTYIYDAHSGAEVHQLRQHTDVNRLQFLPYHFLLASIGRAGVLRYQDVSTGQSVASLRTGLGNCNVLEQNPLSAVLYAGHSNGVVSLWTPNSPNAALRFLANRGPVAGVGVNPRDGGRQMATAGLDGSVKLWDARMLGSGPVKEWSHYRPASDVKFSQRGLLGMSWAQHVSVYDPAKVLASTAISVPGPYLTNNFPRSEPVQVAWCPFEDVLGAAHAKGFDSLIIPGAGEPNFDSTEANPFETKRAKREREVHSLLDKIQPDMITLDPDIVGSIVEPAEAPEAVPGAAIPTAADGRSYASLSRAERLQLDGQADTEHAEGQVEDPFVYQAQSTVVMPNDDPSNTQAKRQKATKERLKQVMRERQKNIIDHRTLMEREKAERARSGAAPAAPSTKPTSALDMFSAPRKKRSRAPIL